MTSSERRTWDVVVIGGGHNGLVAAALLAGAGRTVVVVEAAQECGGPARMEEFYPGYRVATAHLLNRLHPDVVRSLDLRRHGLDLAPDEALPSVALSASGDHLVLYGAYGERLEGAAASEADAWRLLRAQLLRHAGLLKPFLSRRPPELGAQSLAGAAALGRTALALKGLGREDMREFMRNLLMNVADLLDEHLADERLKGLLAFDSVLGCHLGPRSPTSLLGLYYRLTGEAAGIAGAQLSPPGGMGAVTAALGRAAQAAGASIRTGSAVRRIVVEKGRATAVVLDGGEMLAARTIVSAVNPATTFLALVGAPALATGFVRKVANIRMKGDAAKLHLALDGVPGFRGLAGGLLRGRLVVAPSVDHVERAFNPAKYGEFSPEPVMEITLPSLSDASLAPAGACVLSAIVQYAPYGLKEGWASGRPRLLAAIMGQLEAYAPGIGRLVRHAELMTPADIEARYRMPGGHWHHGELQADQMLMSRPVAGWSGYDTPVERLFLAGAGCHPGGGISGLPGLNAARRILEGER